MTYSDDMRRQAVAKRLEQRRLSAEKRERARDELIAGRSRKVADAVAMVIKDTPTFADFEAIADAAMAVDGLQDDPWFADQKHGRDRLRKVIKNDRLTLAMLAEAGVVLQDSPDGIGIPDRATMTANHARTERKLSQRVEAENDLRERERIAFDVNFPKIDLRALTDGNGQVNG